MVYFTLANFLNIDFFQNNLHYLFCVVGSEDNLWELVLPPNHEGSRDQTQEIRLSGRYRYLLSHPTCPK